MTNQVWDRHFHLLGVSRCLDIVIGETLALDSEACSMSTETYPRVVGFGAILGLVCRRRRCVRVSNYTCQVGCGIEGITREASARQRRPLGEGCQMRLARMRGPLPLLRSRWGPQHEREREKEGGRLRQRRRRNHVDR